ncbi:MAG: IPExxxVDY family protein [Bacteroidetes bacterium]|nr:IPExxxVDY family protein [Bacteroidota bacterium]
MNKFKLEIDYDYDFFLAGIVCHEPDYRISWAINKKFNLQLVKDKDIEIHTKSNSVFHFSLFSFVDELNYKEFFLVRNKCGRKNLIPEQKQMDFFLLVKGSMSKENEKELIKDLIEIPFVLMAMAVPVNALPSKQNLIF